MSHVSCCAATRRPLLGLSLSFSDLRIKEHGLEQGSPAADACDLYHVIAALRAGSAASGPLIQPWLIRPPPSAAGAMQQPHTHLATAMQLEWVRACKLRRACKAEAHESGMEPADWWLPNYVKHACASRAASFWQQAVRYETAPSTTQRLHSDGHDLWTKHSASQKC